MKILWITNIPIADMASKLNGKPMGGLWMDALLKELQVKNQNTYVIATSSDTDIVQKYDINDITHYMLPGGFPVHYKRNLQLAKAEWLEIYQTEKPDVLQVWGTEYSHAIPAVMAANEMKLPSVIYIQGIMKAIEKYATGGLPLRTLLRYTTLRDVYRRQILALQRGWFRKRAKTEEQLIRLSGNVVVENEWAAAFCKSVNPQVREFRIPLNINDEFFSVQWEEKDMEKYSIMCNAAGFAYKGFHELLKALLIVKQKYPDVKVYVPGRVLSVKKRGLSRQKVPGYWVYISDFIRKNCLEENVIFTGYLNRSQMAEKLSKVHVFALPSTIENHSSSLKEAMAVGTPSVASIVGGIPEYFEFAQCGYLYRNGEYECLAYYICKLFEDEQMCKYVSENAMEKSRELNSNHIAAFVLEMYEQLASGGTVE